MGIIILGFTYANHLKKLVAKAAKADPEYKVFGASSHKYCLNPVISLKEVRQFEMEYHITLPEEYVFFLTKVGNGGAGPYYGLYSLEKLKCYNDANNPDNPVFIDNSLTLEKWQDTINAMDDCTDEEYDQIESRILSGALKIGTQGCTFGNLLMCQGSETGKIVYDDVDWFFDKPPFLTGMTFLDWYEQFFEEIAADHWVNFYGYKRLGTEEELMRDYDAAIDLEQKAKVLSSFFRFKKLNDKTVTWLMNMDERRFDAAKVRLLLQSDIIKGLTVFESLLTGKNIIAAVDSAFAIPASHKNTYYQCMLKLLYEENAVDKEQILYFLKDCSCKKAADLAAYAKSQQINSKTRQTTIYVMESCDDMNKFI